MPPVGDAVRFVDDKEANPARNRRNGSGPEPLIAQALGRNKQNITCIELEKCLNRGLFLRVCAIDARRTDTDPLRHGELVSHQRKQWAD